MILLLDIGNTRIKWGWLSNGIFQAGGATTHCGHAAQALIGWNEGKRPSRVLAVSVAGASLTAAVAGWVRSHWHLELEVMEASIAAAGVRSGYRDPHQLGADRWAALIGAYRLSESAVCVVDCGSALTIDAVCAAGQHQGGVIMPGWRLMRTALYKGTAELPLVENETIHLFATDTDSAIASGTLLGAAAMIEHLSARMGAELDDVASLWLTGGGAAALLPYLRSDYRHAPELVLQGLAVLATES